MKLRTRILIDARELIADKHLWNQGDRDRTTAPVPQRGDMCRDRYRRDGNRKQCGYS